jgi:hypothetical protein
MQRTEDIDRYADGLRLAGLRESGGANDAMPPAGSAAEQSASLLAEHSRIDLVAKAQHSPRCHAG